VSILLIARKKNAMELTYYPNPDIEMRERVQSLGANSEFKKYVATLLVVRHFWIH
jgi:hypothetical protein